MMLMGLGRFPDFGGKPKYLKILFIVAFLNLASFSSTHRDFLTIA